MRRNRSRRHVTKRECNWKRERRGREWRGRSRSPWPMLIRRGQVKARRDGRADESWRPSWRTNFPPPARWWKSRDRRWCESGSTWTSQYKEAEKYRDRTEWTSRRSREHLSGTIVNAKVYSHGWGERAKINWVFQPCKSRQVTSQIGLIFLRRTMSTQHWSSLVMSQVNTSRVQSVQQNPSAEQQNRVGALVTHHPAWMSHHTGGSRQGHPRYTGAQQLEGRGWPDQEISQSAAHRHEMQKLFNRVVSPKRSKRRTRAMSTNDRWEKDDEFDKERQERLHQRGAWSGQFDRWWEHDQQ